MYRGALRDSLPCMASVLIAIAPSGYLTAARIISSELNDNESRANCWRSSVVQFEAKDVATLTATKPRLFPRRMNIQSEIEFFSDLGLIRPGPVRHAPDFRVAEEAKVGAGTVTTRSPQIRE